MDKNFRKLMEDYYVAEKEHNEAKLTEILDEMRRNLKTRGGEVSEETTFQEMKALNGDFNRKEEAQKLTELCDAERQKQMGRNKYKGE